MKIKNLVFASLAAYQVGALDLTCAISTDCEIRTMVMTTFLDQYEGWRTYLQENHAGRHFLDTDCLNKNVCTYMDET